MTMLFGKKTIASRFTFYSFLILFTLAFLVSLFHFIMSWGGELHRTEQELGHIGKSHIPAITMSLWLTDTGSLKEQLENITLFPYFEMAEVTDDEGVRYTAGDMDTEGLEVHSTNLFYTRRGAEVFLGTLAVYINKNEMRSEVLKKELLPFFVLAGAALGLSIIFSMLFRHMTGRHLSNLSEFLRSNDYTATGGDYSLSRRRFYEDELTALVNSVNEMRENIRDHLQDKNKFFSILAHDLRSPFSGFLGLTRTLHEHYNSFSEEDRKEALFELNQTAERVYALLENLLDWSRIERGRVQYDPCPHPLDDLIEDTCKIFHTTAGQKSISLKVHIPEPLTVRIDGKMTEAILRNLLSNAIKYTEPGGHITITALQKEKHAEVSIHDSGRGMTRDTASRLFTELPRTSEPGTGGERGSGLGLLICKEFTEIQGGTISAESRPEEGTTVRFTLPLAV